MTEIEKYKDAIEILRANINGYMVRSVANHALDILEEFINSLDNGSTYIGHSDVVNNKIINK